MPLARLTQTLVRSFDRDIGAIIARLERHARVADQTAVATELLEASEFRKEAYRRQHEDLKIQCERWLKPSDVKSVHLHQVRARLDGTCNWILSNDAFERWVTPRCSTAQDRLLGISGTHGCGKSILASSIVARLEGDEQHTLFFAFSNSDGRRQTFVSLIRTLLWQLLQETTDIEAVNIVHRLRSDGQPTISELWEAFGRIALSLAKPVYCVVDGLDECIDHDFTMPIRMTQILEICPNLRILLLGRPHVVQTGSGDPAFMAIEITSAILDQDIEAFINDEIAKSDILSLPEFRTEVYQTLKDKSDGMFLWVRLMVDDLKKSSSKFEFSERLQNLPRGLEKAYQLLFFHLSQRLDKFELRLAQDVLAFTVSACRPLNFDEFRYAHALHCRSLEEVAQPLENYLLLQPPQTVLDVTGGLVSMADGVLRIVHSSVGDFLTRPENRWVCEPDIAVISFRIDITKTHRSFAWLCLDCTELENEERTSSRSEGSQSTQAVLYRCPLARYATMYAFYHLNRSGPHCPITLAKLQQFLKSRKSISWIENFAHLLFEDMTLESQMNEYEVWQDRMADAGQDKKLLAIFQATWIERCSSIGKVGKDDDPLTEHLEMYLDQAIDGQTGSYSRKQSQAATGSFLESSTADPDLQTRFPKSRPSSNDPSATVSRVMELLRGQASLNTAHQIELCLRLSNFLRKTRVLIDPLKILFQLILDKASCIPVYALLAIGVFYKRLAKFQEALEVYTAASRKMDHLNVPLRFRIHGYMGDCFFELGFYMEALRSYEKALSGCEIIFGKRHHDSFKVLHRTIQANHIMGEYTEVIRLSDELFMKQDCVPELCLWQNISLQSSRHIAYRFTGDHEGVVQMKKCLQATLTQSRESYSSDDSMCPDLLFEQGYAYDTLGQYNSALGFYQLALEAYKKSKRSRSNTLSILVTQWNIGCMYQRLGRLYEAKEILQKVYAERQKLLGPDHPIVRSNERDLDTLGLKLDRDELDWDELVDDEFDDDELDRDESDDDDLHDDELDEDGVGP